jgi:transcriptional regulator of acetoin/glycerol metabolism
MAQTRGAHHADYVFAVLNNADSPARSAVAASWSRSLSHGLDPESRLPPRRLDPQQFSRAVERAGPLVALAQDVLDRLFQSVGDAGCCVLLTDNEGVPLARRSKVCDDRDFHRLGLWTGAVWNEECGGTNGIGTSLAEGRPLTIYRDEHFFTRNIGLSCTVAPIRDGKGDIVAALDVSNARREHGEALMKLVANATQDAAQKIESRYFRESFRHARILMAPDTARGPGGLIAVDRGDLIVGLSYAARRAYGLTDAQLGRPVNDVLAPSPEPGDDLMAAERGAVLRALSRADNNVTAAARLLGVSRATLHRKIARLRLGR